MKQAAQVAMIAGLLIVLTGSFAAADKIVIMPVAPVCAPQWVGIPNVAGVAYAPNIGQDLFRYQGAFYNHQGGAWFRAPAVTGPWVAVPHPPQVFYTIQAPYFKAPPGWAKGNKKGWGNASMPPGYMGKENGCWATSGRGKKSHGWK